MDGGRPSTHHLRGSHRKASRVQMPCTDCEDVNEKCVCTRDAGSVVPALELCQGGRLVPAEICCDSGVWVRGGEVHANSRLFCWSGDRGPEDVFNCTGNLWSVEESMLCGP